MNRRRILSSLVLSLTVLNAGCTPPIYKDTDRNFMNAQAELDANRAGYQHPKLPVQRVTADSITLGVVHAQPSWLNKRISVRGNNIPFEMLLNRILSRTTGIAVYESSVNRSIPISFNYSGTIRGALEALAAKTNYAYELNGDTLLWSGFVTKTFDISFMPGASQYLLGRSTTSQATTATSSSNVATGFSNNNQYSSLRGSLSVWDDLKRTLESMKSKEGQITVSEATTTITVRDRPENVRTIGHYLASMDKTMSQQVALDVQVLEVELNKSFNYGINWGLVRNFMSGQLAARIGSSDATNGFVSNAGEAFNIQGLGNSASTIGVGILGKSGLWEGTNLFINAIAQQGKVSVSTQPRVITLNNQVAEIGINRQTTYLAQMSTTQTYGAGSSTSLTPGVVSSGFSLYLLPKIQGNNVYLQISSTLSNLEKIGKINVGSDKEPSSIQLPVIAEKRFNQRTVVPTSSTLVLAGFKQLGNSVNKVSMFESDALGGKGGAQSNVETIVLITPTVIRVNS